MDKVAEALKTGSIVFSVNADIPELGGDPNSDHAMVICGYKDPSIDLVRNSWGTGWQVDGYALVAHSHIANNLSHPIGYTLRDPSHQKKRKKNNKLMIGITVGIAVAIAAVYFIFR
jgi:C1A family cysteine protease